MAGLAPGDRVLSALIKEGDKGRLGQIHELGAAAPPIDHTPLPDTQVVIGDEIVTSLEAALRTSRQELAAAVEQHKREMERTRTAAYAEGLEKGRTEVARLSDAILLSLEKARKSISGSLEKSSALSLAISLSCMKKIFGDQSKWADMTHSVIQNEVRSISDATGIKIRVSENDLSVLKRRDWEFGIPELEADRKLAPGDCVIETSFGDVEIGPRTQSRALISFLEKRIPEDVFRD